MKPCSVSNSIRGYHPHHHWKFEADITTVGVNTSTSIVVSSSTSACAASSSLPVAPNKTAISANQVVASPDPVSFSCTVDSYPSSTITWLHNGAEVLAAHPRVTISTVQVDNRTQESNLTLLNTTAEDIGTYTCSALNTEGSANMTTELQVWGECGNLFKFMFTRMMLGGHDNESNNLTNSLHITRSHDILPG